MSLQSSMTGLAALAGLTLAAAAPALALDEVSYGTNWLAQAEHGGFYQAVADGTYEKYGLDVTIVQGGPQAANRALLIAGKVDFYMGSPQGEFDAVVEDIANDLKPHRLCAYLLDLSALVNTFSRLCRVLKSEKQTQRVLLCEAVTVTMRTAFTLLGIEPLMRL